MKTKLTALFLNFSDYPIEVVNKELDAYEKFLKKESGIRIKITGRTILVEIPPPFNKKADKVVSEKTGKTLTYYHANKKELRKLYLPHWQGERMVICFWDEKTWDSVYPDQDLSGQSVDDFGEMISEVFLTGSLTKQVKAGNKKMSEFLKRMLHEGIPGHSCWDHLCYDLKPESMPDNKWDRTHAIDYFHKKGIYELARQAKPYLTKLYI